MCVCLVCAFKGDSAIFGRHEEEDPIYEEYGRVEPNSLNPEQSNDLTEQAKHTQTHTHTSLNTHAPLHRAPHILRRALFDRKTRQQNDSSTYLH